MFATGATTLLRPRRSGGSFSPYLGNLWIAPEEELLMTSLVPPHGGLTEPVCRTVPVDEIDDLIDHAKSLVRGPRLRCRPVDGLSPGDGGLSPLIGPWTATYNRVLDEAVIVHNGKKYAWTIPLALPVTKELASSLAGPEVALQRPARSSRRSTSRTSPWDKAHYLKSVYLTERTDHPGGDMVLKGDADKTHLLGGTIRVLPQPKDPKFGKYVLKPREVRKLLAKKGWDRVVAFQTRNPLHRAHEYALVYGLETLLRPATTPGPASTR